MEKIELKFSATPSLFPGNRLVVVLTLDEKGKSYKAKNEFFTDTFIKQLAKACPGELAKELSENKEELPSLPKRILDAFTENAINKILSKDEIPNESGMVVLDGNHYEITITKGKEKKEYYADDASIETYPLLRYLASWCRRK